MKLTESRHCHNSIDGLGAYTNRPDKYCPNYVNMKKPRKAYWQRQIRSTGNYADKMCWAYICDWCWDEMTEATLEDWEGWPQGDDGKFIGSVECSLP